MMKLLGSQILTYQVYYNYTNVRVEAGDFLRHLAKVRANDILMPFLQFMMSQFDSYPSSIFIMTRYNAIDPTQRDYMAKEWQLYALEVLSPNMLSKDSIRNAVVGFDSWNMNNRRRFLLTMSSLNSHLLAVSYELVHVDCMQSLRNYLWLVITWSLSFIQSHS